MSDTSIKSIIKSLLGNKFAKEQTQEYIPLKIQFGFDCMSDFEQRKYVLDSQQSVVYGSDHLIIAIVFLDNKVVKKIIKNPNGNSRQTCQNSYPNWDDYKTELSELGLAVMERIKYN